MRRPSLATWTLPIALALLAADEPSKPAAEAPKAKSAPTPVPKPKPVDDGPVVMSSEAAAKLRGKSATHDKYTDGPDWRTIPPWKQTSFFGIKAEGQVFIFVVDCSGSMDDEDRLDRAKQELMRTVRAMQQPQRFKVLFYNDRVVPMPGDVPKSADLASKSQLARWLNLVQPGGGTDPRDALALAVALKPDAVFLLSDGAFPKGTVEAVGRNNAGKIPIHCVDLAGGAAGDDLRRIARDSGGQYAAK